MTRKIDATRPFYAVVGVGDLAVEYARNTATDVQTRFSQVELEPKALRDQARTVVVARVDETVATATDAYGDLAARGKNLVSRVRRQQATQDTKAAAKTTKAKAKTTRTQTTKSATKSTDAAKSAAKNTAGTAKRNVKATSTSAKKTASAGTQAASNAAEKVGD